MCAIAFASTEKKKKKAKERERFSERVADTPRAGLVFPPTKNTTEGARNEN
jgi:hypothetical protein